MSLSVHKLPDSANWAVLKGPPDVRWENSKWCQLMWLSMRWVELGGECSCSLSVACSLILVLLFPRMGSVVCVMCCPGVAVRYNVKSRPVPARRVVADAPVRLPSAPASAASGWHWPLRPASFPLQGSAGLPKLGILLMFGITFIGRPIHLALWSGQERYKDKQFIVSSVLAQTAVCTTRRDATRPLGLRSSEPCSCPRFASSSGDASLVCAGGPTAVSLG